MPALNAIARVLLDCLVWASLQAVLLALLVALVQVLLPRLRANARCALWWLIGLQVVVGMCWRAPVRIPLAPPINTFPVHVTSPAAKLGDTAPASAASGGTGASDSHFAFYDWLIALWILGAGAQLPPVLCERKRLKALLRRAMPIPVGDLQLQCELQARQLGLHRCPKILESNEVTIPSMGGLWRPFILLPKEPAWTPAEARYVIAHELAHVKRRDLLLGSIPALAQRLFFFHPLVRWAVREYATYREAACDAQVLERQGVRAGDYGQLLLRLGVQRGETAGLAGASPTFRNLKKRLLLLRQKPASPSRMLAACAWLLVLSIAALGVLPYRVVAASSTGSLAEVAKPQGASIAASAGPSGDSTITVCCGHSEIYAGPSAEGQAVVLYDNGNVLINGDRSDIAAAKPFHKSDGRLLWFRHGRTAYLVHDQAAIRQVKALYTPVLAIARQQSDVLVEQDRLSGQLNILAEREIKVASQQLAFAAEQFRVGNPDSQSTSDVQPTANATGSHVATFGQPSHSASRHERPGQKREFTTEQKKIANSRKALEQKQASLAQQQDVLDSRLQESATSLQGPLGQLLDELVSTGAAQPVESQ